MKLKITYYGNLISDDILLANNLESRLVGLMFRAKPKGGEGLLLEPCTSIHTFFMKYSLDVVFISSNNEVVRIIRNLRPWRMTGLYLKARKTLELPAGKLPRDLKVGDFLEITHV